MKYLCMVHFDEQKLEALSEDALSDILRESLAYDDELARQGHLIVGHTLKSMSDNRLGGYLLIRAKDMAEATHTAAKFPLARLGNVRVVTYE